MLQDNQYYMIELYVIKDVKPEYSLEIQRRQLMERDSLHSWVDKPPGFYFIWNHPYHDRSARHLHIYASHSRPILYEFVRTTMIVNYNRK